MDTRIFVRDLLLWKAASVLPILALVSTSHQTDVDFCTPHAAVGTSASSWLSIDETYCDSIASIRPALRDLGYGVYH